jgi:hypothetical protein
MFVAQEQLLARNTSFRQRFGVTALKVMGSSSPSGVLDPFLEEFNGLGLLSIYTQTNALLGTFAEIDSTIFQQFFFVRKSDGQLAPGAPSPTELEASGIISIESYAAALQTLGTADMRPNVRQGAFAPANGTCLKLYVGDEDPFSNFDQQVELSVFLTGANHVHHLTGDTSVHDQFVFNPGPVATALGH